MDSAEIATCGTCGEPNVSYESRRLWDALVGAAASVVVVCAHCDRHVCKCGRPEPTGRAFRCSRCGVKITKATYADVADVPVSLTVPND